MERHSPVSVYRRVQIHTTLTPCPGDFLCSFIYIVNLIKYVFGLIWDATIKQYIN